MPASWFLHLHPQHGPTFGVQDLLTFASEVNAERGATLVKYDKPQIIDLSQAVTVIHGGQYKLPCACVESLVLNYDTLPAYEADEQ